MLFVSIDKLTIPHNLLKYIDGIELRLDLFSTLDFLLIDHFIKASSKPVMLTLRKALQGGGFKRSEKERKELILKLLALQPTFFDLECDMEEAFLQKTLHNHPLTKFILSHHAMKKKPGNNTLHKIYCQMKKYPAYRYKLAVRVSSASEALEMLLFSKRCPKLSVICVGNKGSFARVLSPVLGNSLNYGSLDDKSKVAPGQLSISELANIYRYHSLNPQTDLYGLIGDPVEKSQGHLYHNKVFAKKNLNAVYVKMNVEKKRTYLFLRAGKKNWF